MSGRRDGARRPPSRDAPTGRFRRGVGRIVTPGRAGGLLGMLAAGYLLTLLTGPDAFAIARADVPTLRWTDASTVEASLAGVAGSNQFLVRTAPLEQRLRELPAVRSAEVTVSLTDATLVVRMTEREPILAWRIGDVVHLVDEDGVIVATRPADGAGPALPAIDDRRRGAGEGLAVGARLDPTDLDVATRLGGVEPDDVGSAADALRVTVNDRDGYVVLAPGWEAVFGFYGPATRSPEMIAGQVRLLRSLLADREAGVQRVVLASDTDGTYVPRTTPRPTRR